MPVPLLTGNKYKQPQTAEGLGPPGRAIEFLGDILRRITQPVRNDERSSHNGSISDNTQKQSKCQRNDMSSTASTSSNDNSQKRSKSQRSDLSSTTSQSSSGRTDSKEQTIQPSSSGITSRKPVKQVARDPTQARGRNVEAKEISRALEAASSPSIKGSDSVGEPDLQLAIIVWKAASILGSQLIGDSAQVQEPNVDEEKSHPGSEASSSSSSKVEDGRQQELKLLNLLAGLRRNQNMASCLEVVINGQRSLGYLSLSVGHVKSCDFGIIRPDIPSLPWH
ncbi:hypothetical protein MMC21_002797 [Puttea exsequens]|nr:hypothetical protein [Puttea exsequens]